MVKFLPIDPIVSGRVSFLVLDVDEERERRSSDESGLNQLL